MRSWQTPIHLSGSSLLQRPTPPGPLPPLISSVLTNSPARNKARAILMLGPESGSLSSSAISALANAVLTTSTDLAVASYDLPPHAGLVNSAILYPLTRALFATRARFPLAIDLGLSLRMAERLAALPSASPRSTRSDALLWPVNEAAVAGFTIDQFDVGPRALPQPAGPDLNTILPLVTGSLFSDIDAKAAFWQRSRQLPPRASSLPTSASAVQRCAAGYHAHDRGISPRLHQPPGNLVARPAAQHAAGTETALC